MNSNKDYKKLYNKYKLKYLALKKKFNIEEDNLNIADNMLSFLNSSEEFNQIGGTYMKHNDEYFNIQEKIPLLTKATDVSDADEFNPTCITQPVITIPNNGMLEPTNKYFLPMKSEEAQKYSNKCMFISIYQYIKIKDIMGKDSNKSGAVSDFFKTIDFDHFRSIVFDGEKIPKIKELMPKSYKSEKYYKQFEEWDETDEVDEDERKQKWLSDLREEIEQDNLDMSEPINSNNEQYEAKYDTLDFSEEGVYEDLVGTAEDRAEYYMNQSIIAYEEEQLNQTQEHLNEEAEEEICFELADDKEFKKTIEDNDEFNERNNPIFID